MVCHLQSTDSSVYLYYNILLILTPFSDLHVRVTAYMLVHVQMQSAIQASGVLHSHVGN